MNHSSATDEELIARFQAGEASAFAPLMERYQSRVRSLAQRFVKDREEAEEVCQEVSLLVYQNLKQFEGKSSFATWLYRVTVNASLMHLRNRPCGERVPLSELEEELAVEEEEESGPDEQLMTEESLEKIEREIEKLPEEFQTVIILRDIEGFSLEETAEVLSLSLPAVKSRLHRARLFLRRRLKTLFQETVGKG